METIDLRSDTVTLPTPEMLEAMMRAELGDDVYGEDATINRLQEMSAERMGMQAGLFVPSGTMGNLIAVLAHCQRGDEAIMGTLGHTFLFEAGGVSALGGVFAHTLANQADGTLLLDEIEHAIRPNDIHHPVSKLVILENTHNRCGGVVLTKDYTAQVGHLAHDHGLNLHIDGARIFNAAVTSNLDVRELVAPADSVTFCLSKGLCAPVGSVLCGSKDFIQHARRLRKMLGGGMRQAGVLAAAGIVALEKMVDRLSEDHRRANKLAEGLSSISGLVFEMGMPETNMVFPSIKPGIDLNPSAVSQALAKSGIKIGVVGDRKFRLVTHAWITDDNVEKTITSFRKVFES